MEALPSPRYGWDYRTGMVEPPPGTAATWVGWNVQRSVDYIEHGLRRLAHSAAVRRRVI
jgi:hypothetical protein